MGEGSQRADVHKTDQELRDDYAWVNKLARYLERDPQVYDEVRFHIAACKVCLNVVAIWSNGGGRHNFLRWVFG